MAHGILDFCNWIKKKNQTHDKRIYSSPIPKEPYTDLLENSQPSGLS